RFWFLEQLEPGNPAFNVVQAVRLLGAARVAVLAAVFAEIVRRHEVLRTTFEARDGQPVQEIHPSPTLVLPVVDLSGLPAAGAAALALAQQDKLRTFALDRWPLLRVTLLRLGPEEHWLLLAMHHIVS